MRADGTLPPVFPRTLPRWLILACVAWVGPSGGAEAAQIPPAATRRVEFGRDIAPILSASCHSCHGDKKQESGLRLDSREALLKGGEHGPALVPGRSADSLLVQVVAGAHPEISTMPQRGDKLTAAQIGLLRGWIDQGAEMPAAATATETKEAPHWAFLPPQATPAPKVKQRRQVRNPIDAFVLQRLEREGWALSDEAEKTTLIRRLSLDLIGLPPTPAEVDAFLADRSRDAYPKLVERLLASPHYGEKWGRWWLDAARYADSNGFEKDRTRSIWPYRDWVIHALNADKPFDDFTVEQLAGDLLVSPASSDREALDLRIATGYLRNSMVNMEGGIDPEQFRVESLIDRVDAVGRTWLGLTVACAQCHNHKYDPISIREYYQFYAFLNQDDEPRLEVPTPAQAEQRRALLARVAQLEDELMAEPATATKFEQWRKNLGEAKDAVAWRPMDAKEWHSTPMKFEKQEDLSLLGGGDVYNTGVLRVWVDVAETNITGFRLEALNNANLPFNGPGIDGSGDFLVTEFTVEATPLAELHANVPGATNAPATTNQIVFRRVMADWDAPEFPAAKMIDGLTTNGGWASARTQGRRNEERRAVFETEKPFGFPGGTRLQLTLNCKPPGGLTVEGGPVSNYLIGRVRFSLTTQDGPLAVDPLSEGQRKWLSGGDPLTRPAATPSPSDEERAGVRGLSSANGLKSNRSLFRAFLFSEPSLAEAAQRWDALWADWPKAGTTTLALSARPTPRVTRTFRRGDWKRPGDEVTANTPKVLPAFPESAPRNRLGLARWIVDPANPLTARVIVNRVWQQYFGEGLVTTPEDFGVRSERPSHPELLDWLALEFIRQDWSLKSLHRLIVGSATYRQSSRVTAEQLEKDAYNRLLGRAPRLRVEAETVQDIALRASGLLSPKIGGPSVFPALPEGVMSLSYGPIPWNVSEGEDRYRRGLYTFWKRSVPYPALVTFDAPTAEQSCVRRVRSNTPLQALVTLNEPTFNQAARWLGYRVLQEAGPADEARLVHAFRLCTARVPDRTELAALKRVLNDFRAEFADDAKNAAAVAFSDPKNPPPLPAGASTTELAAWSALSRTLLNLDETITKE